MSEPDIDLQNIIYRIIEKYFWSQGLAFWPEQSIWWVQKCGSSAALIFTTFGEMLEFLLMDVEQTR